MLDDLDWAAADLQHATDLMRQSEERGVSINEVWSSGEFTWHMRTWQDKVPVGRGETMGGLWNVSLTAESSTSRWSFSWTGDGWFAT